MNAFPILAKGRGSLHFYCLFGKKLIGTEKADSKWMLRYAAPPSCGFKLCAAPAWGLARTNPGRSQHALFRASCVTRCAVTQEPFALYLIKSETVTRQRVGSLHFQTSYPRERFEEKNYRQIAAPPSCGFKLCAAPAAGARKDETQPVTTRLVACEPFQKCVTRVRSLRDPLPLYLIKKSETVTRQRVAAVCIPDQLSKGTLKKKTTGRLPRPFLWFRLLRKFNSGARKDEIV